MNLGWYVRRLRSMEPAEVAHRVAEALRKRSSRTRDEGWGRYPPTPLKVAFPAWPARIVGASQHQREAIRLAAESVLAGEFSALGRNWPRRDSGDPFPATLWRLDPVTGGLWPIGVYCFDIDTRRADLGDIKYVWEINRLQFLPVLAAYALLDDDARSLEMIEVAIASWYEANPPFRGVTWASGIEVALRAISLIAALSIVGDRLSSDTRERIASILNASAFWLPRFPSRFSSANNHRVAELAGEYLTALALGHDASSTRRELAGEIELQILPDGAPAEQSPTYGAFTAELALLCVEAAQQTGAPFAVAVEQRLAAFAGFVQWISDSRFGDDDEGRAITLGGETNYPSSVAAAILATSGRPASGAGAAELRELLFGSSPATTQSPTGLMTFREGGLTIWRGTMSGRAVCFTFDHGPLGYLSIAAHGHADALSITLSVDGQPVLVDPGTYLYGSGGAWRDWFRSTPAHNTLNIGGESQSVMTGPFNWAQKAVSTLHETQAEPDWRVSASHDGYQRRFGVIHERSVERRGEEVVISDRLLGSPQKAEIVFQFAPGLRLERRGSRVIAASATGALASFEFADQAFEIVEGSDEEMAGGWVSPAFGMKVPAPRLVWRGAVDAGGVPTRLRIERAL